MRHNARREVISVLVKIVTEAQLCLHGTELCPRRQCATEGAAAQLMSPTCWKAFPQVLTTGSRRRSVDRSAVFLWNPLSRDMRP
jgi:hypothetical protein